MCSFTFTEKRLIFPEPIFINVNLTFDGGGGVDSIQLLSELFSQPKLDIFRGVGYGLGDTKFADS